MSKQTALTRLRRALDQVDEVARHPRFSSAYKKWRRDTQVAIEYIFGPQSRHIGDFDGISYSPGLWTDSTPESHFENWFKKGLEEAKVVLQSMLDEVEEYWPEDSTTQVHGSQGRADRAPEGHQVFIVHGHDSFLKEEVARFLEKLGLEPVVLHEQPDRGRTIIEKFEEHAADVAFAIALFTPDDEGRRVGTAAWSQRARQNVLFEFGYFVGRLGRGHALALIRGELETPSDYDGVIYVPADPEQAWKLRIVKELKAAGIDVDANMAI